jgi:hypothetical protein
MFIPLGRLRRSLFGLPSAKTALTARGFYQGNQQAQDHFQHIFSAFAQGYHAALEDHRLEALVPRLQAVDAEFRGFAFEGAALELACLDYFCPWKQRFQAFACGPGGNHIYELHIGAGWTLGRLPRNIDQFLKRFDPLLRWLVVDGYGFCAGFCSWRRFLQDQMLPPRLSGYALRAFDQGLGRSLWFVKGADAAQIIATIQAFPACRQRDLWSGVGVACAYAGGGEHGAIQELSESARTYRPYLAQGSTFAAMARKQAGNPVGYTSRTCEVFSGYSSEEAIKVARESMRGLPLHEGAYEIWRSQVCARLA